MSPVIGTKTLADGSIFAADTRSVGSIPPMDIGEGADLAAWVSDKWNLLYQLKRGETERLKVMESYYSGFPYQDPWDNRTKPTTNYCFGVVETIVPILLSARPRPDPVPRSGMTKDAVTRLKNYCTYKMDSSGFDRVMRMSARDLIKFGWCCPKITWDAQGRSVPTYMSPFDFYPDGSPDFATTEVFAIAHPVSVRRLKAEFPDKADLIKADNIASPSYEVYIKPYLENYSIGSRINMPQFIGTMAAKTAIIEGSPASNTLTGYVADTGYFMAYGETAFLIQLFVRDYSTMKVRYEGYRYTQTQHGVVKVPHDEYENEPCSPSGWLMVPVLANGTVLSPPLQVDECMDGVPLEIGRNYDNGGRFFSLGDLDQIVPIQRDINRTDEIIYRSLELQGNPAVKLIGDSRLMQDRDSIEGGDIMRLARGSIMEFLQPQPLAGQHFERRAGRRQDIQIVAGTPDSLAGQRPIGIEAAAAVRMITEAGASRARAKGPELLDYMARLLKKMVRADAYKSNDVIYFTASDGSDMWIRPEELLASDFDIRWAQESGDAQSAQDRKDLNMNLLQMGVIDPQQVLEDLDYPGREAIVKRMSEHQLAMAQAQGQQGGGAPPRSPMPPPNRMGVMR